MAANWAKTQFVKLLSNKRKAAEEGLNSLLRMDVEIAKKRIADELFYEEEVAQAAALSAVLLSKKPRQERSHDEPRNNNWWSQYSVFPFACGLAFFPFILFFKLVRQHELVKFL